MTVVATSALAQPGPGEPAPPAEIDQGVVDDALSPGAFLAPTALTEPAGTISASVGGFTDTSFDSKALSHVSVAYAATNQISLSATLELPGQIAGLTLGTLSAKAQMYRAGRVRVALQGNLLFATESGNSSEAVLVGGAGTLCLDDACNSYVTGYAGFGFEHSSGSGVPVLLSGAAAVQVVPHLKLLAELVSGFSTSDVSGVGNGALLFYGVRATDKNVGVNLGAVTTLGVGNSSTALLATATVRFKP